MSLKIVTVVGARPQFIKAAAVSRVLRRTCAEVLVHTGQHYDDNMSKVFFDELDMPPPDCHLGIGSGNHGAQTGAMLAALEEVLVREKPDRVLVYGDTNSTLAATLAAAKLHVPLAHVEAGLRSFNRLMPEEANRVVADQLSDLLFAPTPEAMKNLANEGLGRRARQVGDVMLDVMRAFAPVALERSGILARLGLPAGGYLVATLHRAENTPAARLGPLLEALGSIGRAERPIVLPMHPRTAHVIRDAGLALPAGGGLRVIEPLGYLDMIALVARARIVLTDSGGLQKEAFFLGRPCVTLREETEWVETVAGGGNVIVGTDAAKVRQAVAAWDAALARGEPDFSRAVAEAFGDGAASAKIVAQILEFLASAPRR